MPRRSLKQSLGRITARVALLLQAALPALADPPVATPASPRPTQEILMPLAGSGDRGGGWLRRGFHLQKKSGFAYTHRFTGSDHPLVFRIQGPVMRKQKALGLTFKLRF